MSGKAEPQAECNTQVKEWHRKARLINPGAYPILVGTKFDLFAHHDPQSHPEATEIQTDVTNKARAFARALHAPLVFCSSACSINVQKLFQLVVAHVFKLDITEPWATSGIRNIGEPILETTAMLQEVDHVEQEPVVPVAHSVEIA